MGKTLFFIASIWLGVDTLFLSQGAFARQTFCDGDISVISSFMWSNKAAGTGVLQRMPKRIAGKGSIKGPRKGTSKQPELTDEEILHGMDSSLDPNSSYGGQCGLENSCKHGFHCENESCVPNSTDSPTEVSACEQQHEALLQKCRSQIDETANDCDEKKDSGMNSVMNGASQMTLALGQSTASSVQKSCSDMAGLMQGANAALAGYRLACGNSISTCNEVCGELLAAMKQNPMCKSFHDEEILAIYRTAPGAQEAVSSAEKEAAKCNAFQSKVNEAAQAIKNYAQTLGNAQNCQTASSGDLGIAKLCASQPNYPGCKAGDRVDCSKPDVAATNKVCICSRNPMDPACLGDQKITGSVGLGPNIDSGSRLGKTNAEDGFGGNLLDLPVPDSGNVNTAAGKPIDGHQGGGAALGGGDSGAGGGPAGGGSSAGSNGGTPASSSGFYGGSGSGMRGSVDSNSGGGVSSGRYAAGAGPAGKLNVADLRKFLPGGKFDPKRGISGMTGPDGITGPHTNIWQKVQNRYRVTSPSLLP